MIAKSFSGTASLWTKFKLFAQEVLQNLSPILTSGFVFVNLNFQGRHQENDPDGIVGPDEDKIRIRGMKIRWSRTSQVRIPIT
jgi:hypothetical protein